MFLIQLTYRQPLEVVDQYLAAHRAFLQEGYQNDYFIVSGPKHPRTGGVIISQLTDREQLEQILAQDPFQLNQVAQYVIIEFEPVKYHKDFVAFVSKA